MTSMRNRSSVCLRWLAVFGFATIIFLASELPPARMPTGPFPHADKVLHAGAYAALAMLLFRALWADLSRPIPTGVLLLGVIMATLYGASDEFHQIFTNREFDVWDMAANGVGASLAATVWEPLTDRYRNLR